MKNNVSSAAQNTVNKRIVLNFFIKEHFSVHKAV